MMSEFSMSIVRAFEKLPKTREKAEIASRYNNDEIGTFDFLQKAEVYIRKHGGLKK